MLFLAMFLILARLYYIVSDIGVEICHGDKLPVLEPDLYRSLSHVDLVGNALPGEGSRGGVLVELVFQSNELILGRSLPLLVLLLLSKCALPGWST